MRIVVIGTRGIPDILGGVETHCEELYPRIVKRGHEVTIIRRSCYINPENKIDNYKGVHLIDIFAPKKKSLEAIIHTFLAILKAKKLNPDIVHIHAIGPNLMAPVAKLLGLKVVMTHHGPDYDRDKWSKLAKIALKIGEWCGAKFSDKIIVISNVISSILEKKYNRTDVALIFNGVRTPIKSPNNDYINSLGLTSKKYVVGLGRFVKEKNFHQLIDAFAKLNRQDYKLVLAGDADHKDDYSEWLKRHASTNGVVLTGFIKGEKLNQILTNAALFVLPSSHEGLPISLLEAMSYNLDVLVSNIPANRISQLEETDFFEVGNTEALAEALQRKLSDEQCGIARNYDLSDYNWGNIANQTIEVYKSLTTK